MQTVVAIAAVAKKNAQQDKRVSGKKQNSTKQVRVKLQQTRLDIHGGEKRFQTMEHFMLSYLN